MNLDIDLSKSRQSTDKLYESLHEGRTIRLVKLEAGQEDDPLRGRLLCADLSGSDLRFEALSYVWGAPEISSFSESSPFYYQRPPGPVIHLDDHELPITLSLEGALRALRFKDVARFIWVDAICINQNDSRERGHQVTLMSSIHKNATQVIVWLGEPPSKHGLKNLDPHDHDDVQGERAFGAICDVVNHWLRTRPPGPRASYGVVTRCHGVRHFRVGSSMLDMMDVEASELADQRKLLEDDMSLESPKDPELAESPLWHAIQVLFDRSWFWRLWVFKEIVLARAAVVRMGHAEIDWKWIGLAAAILRTTYHGTCEKIKLGGVYNAYLMFRSSGQSDLPRVKFDFLRLLRLTRQFEVTDPRDRIYGLLGITTDDNKPNEGRLLVRPDYTLSTGRLWKKLAVMLLTNTDDLSLQSCVQYHVDKLESDGFCYEDDSLLGRWPEKDADEVSVPSWVPQWDHVFRATISPWDSAEHFSTTDGMPRTLGKPLTSETLVLQGIEIGVVGHGLPFMWHEADISLLQSKHLKSFFRTEVGLRMLATTLTAGRNAYGSILRHNSPALADLAAYVLSWQDHEPNHAYSWSSQSWYGALKPQQLEGRINNVTANLKSTSLKKLAVGGDATRFAETAMQYCECWRLFLTMNGYLGLGPDTLQEGDVLCLLGGGDMPYILRPLKQEDSSKTRYLFVGESYVEGLMNGEGVKSLALGTTLVGGVPPDLVLQTIFENIRQESQRSMKIQESKLEEEYNETQQLLVAARHEILEKAMKLQVPQKCWFEIC